MITTFLLESLTNKFLIFLAINLILLIVGTFMDMTPAVLIFSPIFLAVLTTLGMDPVHFGIVIVLNLCIGICTSPLGTLLFVGSGVANVSVTKVIKALLPFLAIMLTVLMLISVIPEISMLLPRMFGLS